jgi:DNA-directed RNA polymerase specialized sigma24 family protein
MKTSMARQIAKFVVNHENAQTDDPHQEAFDTLVQRASEGDNRAIGAIAVSVGPTLLEEARIALGDFEQEAEDVLNDFFACLLERRMRFTPAHGRAMPWMCGIVQAIAQQRRREFERDWGLDGA